MEDPARGMKHSSLNSRRFRIFFKFDARNARKGVSHDPNLYRRIIYANPHESLWANNRSVARSILMWNRDRSRAHIVDFSYRKREKEMTKNRRSCKRVDERAARRKGSPLDSVRRSDLAAVSSTLFHPRRRTSRRHTNAAAATYTTQHTHTYTCAHTHAICRRAS